MQRSYVPPPTRSRSACPGPNGQTAGDSARPCRSKGNIFSDIIHANAGSTFPICKDKSILLVHALEGVPPEEGCGSFAEKIYIAPRIPPYVYQSTPRS